MNSQTRRRRLNSAWVWAATIGKSGATRTSAATGQHQNGFLEAGAHDLEIG